MLACVVATGPAGSEPLRVPFDFSRSEIGVAGTIKGTPVYTLLDSGVDPSTIDLGRARALHLKIDQAHGGEISGTGSGKGPPAFPTAIEGLTIAGRDFPGFEALAVNLDSISSRYGRRIDAVLGFSFLKGKVVLIDYPAHLLEIGASPADANVSTRSCRMKWSADLRLIPGENWPSFAAFRLGPVSAPVTLDTGSNSYLMLYRGALALPRLRATLVGEGTTRAGGFRGGSTRRKYSFSAPLGFGPFSLTPGASVMLDDVPGPDGVVANAGNKLFDALKVKMLLDYRAHRMAFFGDCS